MQQADRPQTKDEVKSFLCMIRSNGQFIPDLAAATANLRELTKTNTTFQWLATHEKEFQNLKEEAFKEDVLLRHYDMNVRTFIFVDAHNTGLSAILIQGPSIDTTKSVAIASRTTTAAEKTTHNWIWKPLQSILAYDISGSFLSEAHQLPLSLINSPWYHCGPPNESHHLGLSVYFFATKMLTTKSSGAKGKKTLPITPAGMLSLLKTCLSTSMVKQKNTKSFFFFVINQSNLSSLFSVYIKPNVMIGKLSVFVISSHLAFHPIMTQY